MAFTAVLTGTGITTTLTSGQNTFTLGAADAQILVGSNMQGTGIPAGTKVLTISGTAGTMTNNATASGAQSVIYSSRYGSTLTVSVTGAADYFTPQDIVTAGFATLQGTRELLFVGGLTVTYAVSLAGGVFDFGNWTMEHGVNGRWQFDQTSLGEFRGGYLVNGTQFIKTAGPTFYYSWWNNGGAGGSSMFSGTSTGSMTGLFRMHNPRFVERAGSNTGAGLNCGRLNGVVENCILDYQTDSAGANAGIGWAFGTLKNTYLIKSNGSFSTPNSPNIATIDGLFYVGNYQAAPEHKFGIPNGYTLDKYSPNVTSSQFLGGFSPNSTENYSNPDFSTAGWGLSNLKTRFLSYGGWNIRNWSRRVSFQFRDSNNAVLTGVTLYIKGTETDVLNAVQTGDYSANTIGLTTSWWAPYFVYRPPEKTVDNIDQLAQVRKYGYIQQSASYSINTDPYSQPFFMLPDTSVAGISEATAAAITAVVTGWDSKTVSVVANATYDHIAAELAYELPLVVNSAKLDPRNISGTSLTLANGWSVVVMPGATLTEGTNVKFIYADTFRALDAANIPSLYDASGNLTENGVLLPTTQLGVQTNYSGVGSITGLHRNTTGPSARLITTGLTASSLAVIDNTGASYDFASGLTGSRSAYFAPGKTGTWTAIAERLGYKRQTFTFTPGSGGDFAFAPLWIPDTSLIVTDPAVSSAYTLVQDQNKTLDRIAYERTTAEGIAVDKAFKDGTYLNWGNADVLFVASAADPLVYDAALNKFTVAVGATRIPGSTMYGDRTTGRITAGAGVTIMSAFVDADGLRVLVSGLDAQAFGITWNLRYKLHTASTWTVLSGTGNSTTILMTEALYDVQVRVPGYDWKTTSIDTAKTQALDLLLNYQTTSTGQPQYTQPFDAAIEASFNYDATAMKVAVSNTGGALIYPSFNDVYRAIQRIMHISSLVWQWSNPVTYNSQAQKVIIPTGNPISMYLTEASNASVILTCQVVHEASGASAEDRVKGNSAGFFIKLGNQATADSASIATTIIGQLGGPNFVSGTHGLSVIKDTIGTVNTNVLAVPAAVWSNPVRTLTSAGASGATLAEIEASTVLAKEATAAAIKAKTDNLPAAPAAVGSAMTLTGAYDAAKTAATQTSVDTLSTDLDTLDQLVQALPTLLEIEASTTLAKAADVSAVPTAVRTELFTELARIDATVSSRSTLTTGDIPEGLTADDVWTATTRTLTETPGLTTGQAEQLRKVAQLHGVGAQLVVTETTRTAGDVSQTLTTDEDGNTTVSAA